MPGKAGYPNYYAGSTSSNWNDDCETSAGDSYSGYVYTGNGDTSWWLSAGAVIETADGRRLEMAGTASAWRSESEGGISQSGSVKGTFKAKGGAASDTWLEEDYSPDLTVSSWWGVGDWGTKHITLQGVVGITAEKASIVSFDQVRSYGDVKGTVERARRSHRESYRFGATKGIGTTLFLKASVPTLVKRMFWHQKTAMAAVVCSFVASTWDRPAWIQRRFWIGTRCHDASRAAPARA